MTGPSDPLAEALALLAEFERSAWGCCHVRTRTLEVFISRQPHPASPMRADAAVGASAGDPAFHLLAAPHVATLRSISSVGETVQAGGVYAVVDVLDEAMELLADHAGVVVATLARAGDLVEHAQPLLRLQAW